MLGFARGLVGACALLAAACTLPRSAGDSGSDLAGTLRINQIQSVGTHNSYKLPIPDPVMAMIAARNPQSAITLDYSHRPLAEQLDAGARQLEFDPNDDAQGGAHADPMAPRLLKAQGVDVPISERAAMMQPGIKVLHVADIDYRSSCLTLRACFEQVKAWSDANRDHTPILIMINPKHGPISWEGATPVPVFGSEAFARMEADIRAVFPADRIITPDEVRGTHATLREGAIAGGWPTLEQARGRMLFVIDDAPSRWAAYSDGHPSLKGRLAFVNANAAPDAAEAAVFVINDPVRDFDLIRAKVAAGFLVRTRADADTHEARSGDTKRREAAFASGAQFVTTDYIWQDKRFSDYAVALPGGGQARCNPVNAPTDCLRR